MYRRASRQTLGSLAVFQTLAEAREHPAGRSGLDQNLDARLVQELFREPRVFRKQVSLAGAAPDEKAVECGLPNPLLAVLLEERDSEAALVAALVARAAQTLELVRLEQLEQQEPSLPLVPTTELASPAWRAVECGRPVHLLVVQRVVQAEPQRQERESAQAVRKQSGSAQEPTVGPEEFQERRRRA